MISGKRGYERRGGSTINTVNLTLLSNIRTNFMRFLEIRQTPSIHPSFAKSEKKPSLRKLATPHILHFLFPAIVTWMDILGIWFNFVSKKVRKTKPLIKLWLNSWIDLNKSQLVLSVKNYMKGLSRHNLRLNESVQI